MLIPVGPFNESPNLEAIIPDTPPNILFANLTGENEMEQCFILLNYD